MATNEKDPNTDSFLLEGNISHPQNLTDWENEPTVMTLKEDLERVSTAHGSIVSNIEKWISLRDVKTPRGTGGNEARNNRSRIKPKLVRRQAEWRYSALSEPFLNTKKLFQVEPETWEDTPSAEQNELILNWQMRTKINTVKFIDEFVRTAVDEGTVIVRPGWKRESRMEEVENIIYEPQPIMDEEMSETIVEAMELLETDPSGFEQLPEELRESVYMTQEYGQFVMAVPVGSELIEEEKVLKNEPTLDILDTRNVFIDTSCEGDIDKANFAIIAFETSKAELIADGRYSNLDSVIWENANPQTDEKYKSRDNSDMPFKDELRKRVTAYEYWGFYDIHGNDELIPIVATWIGNTMIRMEENPYPDQKIPLVIAHYLPVRKSVAGEPDAEILEDNQQVLGAVLRGMIDLLGRSANGQTGFAKGMLDTTNRIRYERGMDYEFNPNNHPTGGIHQHTYPEISNSAITMFQMQNNEAEALTGIKAFSGGLSSDTYGQVATGIRGMLDAAGTREMSILRRLAQGMEQIGRKIISMNSVFLTDEEVIRVTNDPNIAIRTEHQKGEHNLIVDISTAEIDERKAQDLGFMLQTMGNTLPFELTKLILQEIAKLKRMPALAHAIKNFTPEPDPMEEKKKELEIAEIDAKIQRIQQQARLDAVRADKEIAMIRKINSETDITDLKFIEQETGTSHERDIDKIATQARSNQDLAVTQGMIDAAVNALNPSNNKQD